MSLNRALPSSVLARAFFRLVILAVLVCLYPPPLEASSEWKTRPGTVAHTRALADGSRVVLDAMLVTRVAGPWIFVKDPWSARDTLPVFVRGRVIERWWSVEITGYTRTVEGQRIVVATAVRLYVCANGRPFILMPKGPRGPWDWPYMRYISEPLGVGAMEDIPPLPGEEEPVNGPPSVPIPGTIAWAKTFADSESLTQPLTGKIVVAVIPGALYIEEPSRTAGIRVVYSGSTQVTRGMTVDVLGTLHTGEDGEREILAGGQGLTIPVTIQSFSYPYPLGMTNRTFAAPYGPSHTGMIVRTWGRVTAVDSGNTYLYIDDGSGVLDGSGNTGVKVIWSWPTITPPSVDWYVGVTGISGIEQDTIHVLTPRSLSNPKDVTLFTPGDTTDPTVSITTPAGTDLLLPPGATSAVISGTASDSETGVASVQVRIGETGTWNLASYNSVTHVWTYTWQSPASATVYVHATDFAGRYTDIYRAITVSTVDVIYVDSRVTGGNGASWGSAYSTVTAALSSFTSGTKDIWVAKGTYVGCVTMKSNVSLFGGFAGGESSREQRNWIANRTALDGNQAGSVITMSNVSGCTVDGFTIVNGKAGAYNGGGGAGMRLTQSSAVIAHNIMKGNVAVSSGGGISASSSSLSVVNNWIVGNLVTQNISGNAFGSAIDLYSCPNALIANNTMVGNTSSGYSSWVNSVSVRSSSGALVANNIVAFSSHGIAIDGTATAFNNDLYQITNNGSGFVQPGTSGNISADPGFVDAAHCDFHITGSGCKNLGLDTVSLPDALDIDGENRRNGQIDIGADEWNGADPTPAVTIFRVKPDGNDASSGETWALAKQTIQKALDAAWYAGGGEIWVKGTGIAYNSSITARSFVYLYGGFDESDNSRSDRDWGSNVTIISGSGDVVTMSGIPNQWSAIDGFTIRGGTRGIYLNYASGTIAHNIIADNGPCTSGNGAGITCKYSSPTIANNFVVGNSTSAYNAAGGIYLYSSDVQVLNNTIAGNTSTSTDQSNRSAGGLNIYSGNPTVTNNIVASNSSGIYINYASCVPTYNDVWGNTVDAGYWQPGTTLDGPPDSDGNIIKDPKFLDVNSEDVHILWASGCRDAGFDAVVLPDSLDIDAQARRYGPIDIGADETTECWRYTLALTPEATSAPMGDLVTVTAYVFDAVANQPTAGYQVDLSVDAGEIISVTRNGTVVTLPPGTQSTYGITGTDGKVETVVTRADEGCVRVVGTITDCSTQIGRTVIIWFYDPGSAADWPMFHHDIALRGVTPASIGSSLSDPDPAKRLPKRWVAQLSGNSSTSQEHTWASPVVANGVVYVGTNAGWLYAFDSVSGTQLAALNVGSPIHGTPCVNNGLIYVGAESGGASGAGRLHVYALQSGQFVEQWYYDCCGTSHTVDSNQRIWGSISVYNGAVYFGSTYATSPTSDYGWFHTVDLSSHQDRSGSPIRMRYTAIGNTPGIDIDYTSGPRAYLSDYSCYVASIVCQTGASAWGTDGWHADGASMYASPVAYQGCVFVGSDNNCVYRLTDTGSTATYSAFSAGGYVESTPAAYSGKIYFGCNNNSIYCVDAQTLQQSSVKSLGSAVISSPAISSTSGLVFVASSVASQSNATIYALDATNLSNQMWSYNIYADHSSAVIKSSPAVTNGQMFIVAGDSSYRYLYCFGD